MPLRHRLSDAERIADRQHEIADLQRVGIADVDRGEFLARLESSDREIGARIAQHDLGLEFAPVGEGHANLRERPR